MTDSYLDIGLKVADLQKQMRLWSPKLTKIGIAKLNADINAAISRQLAAPRRSQDDIIADIKKYSNERDHISANRTPITGPGMSLSDWMHDCDDSTGFWANTAEGTQLAKLQSMLDILNAELVRK